MNLLNAADTSNKLCGCLPPDAQKFKAYLSILSLQILLFQISFLKDVIFVCLLPSLALKRQFFPGEQRQIPLSLDSEQHGSFRFTVLGYFFSNSI